MVGHQGCLQSFNVGIGHSGMPPPSGTNCGNSTRNVNILLNVNSDSSTWTEVIPFQPLMYTIRSPPCTQPCCMFQAPHRNRRSFTVRPNSWARLSAGTCLTELSTNHTMCRQPNRAPCNSLSPSHASYCPAASGQLPCLTEGPQVSTAAAVSRRTRSSSHSVKQRCPPCRCTALSLLSRALQEQERAGSSKPLPQKDRPVTPPDLVHQPLQRLPQALPRYGRDVLHPERHLRRECSVMAL